jgi:hypothetical protein
MWLVWIRPHVRVLFHIPNLVWGRAKTVRQIRTISTPQKKEMKALVGNLITIGRSAWGTLDLKISTWCTRFQMDAFQPAQ